MFKSGDLGAGEGGGSTTFSLFAFRYAVVALAQWADFIQKCKTIK